MAAVTDLIGQVGRARFAALYAVLLSSAALLAVGLGGSWWIVPEGLVNENGQPVGRDFITFMAASALALAGDAAAVYDHAALYAVETRILGQQVNPVWWHYPPTFLLMVLPLATMPYLLALVLWLAVPFAALLVLLHRFLPHPATPFLVPLFPGISGCLVAGQNGILSAALLAAGLFGLERRPMLAGFFLGLLTYKPHMALLVGPALICGRRWRALAGALIGAGGLMLGSVILFGPGLWLAFFRNLNVVADLVQPGQLDLARMPTVYAAARLAGLGAASAQLLQGAATLAAAAVVSWVWWRGAALGLRAAALAAGTLLAAPYAFDYDTAILIIPLAAMAREGIREGFRRGEFALLLVLWTLPFVGWLVASATNLQAAPAVLALTLAAICRRVSPEAAGPVAWPLRASARE